VNWKLSGKSEFGHSGALTRYNPLFRSEPYQNTETRMERLYFACPHTQQDIDVGIDSELNTLLRIRNNHVLARCPVCGESHEWEVREARLLQAA